MKPSEVVRSIDLLGPQPFSVRLLHIANRADELTTESGMRLRDQVDLKTFFIECYHAQIALERLTQGPQLLQLNKKPDSFRRFDDCPDCGHIHLDEKECGFPIGGNRKCLCERKVTA